MFEHQKPNKKAEHLRWGHLKLAPGQREYGWVCGPVFGCSTHWDSGTKPCRARLTSNGLTCRYCIAQMETGYSVWVPLFNQVGQKVVAMVGADLEEAVSAIPFGSPVKVSKGKYRAAPIVIQVNEWTAVTCPHLGRLRCQHDIRPWLLQLWGDKELQSYYGSDPQAIPLPAVTDNTVTSSDRTEEVSKVKALLKNRIGANKSEEIEALRGERNGKHPSTNGKHKTE